MTVVNLYEELVILGDYSFFITDRLTQDALENLFSQIRGFDDEHLSGIHFRLYLQQIMISQFMEVLKTTSYDTNNTPNLIDVLNQVTIIHEHDDIHFLSIDLPTFKTMNSEHEKGEIIYDLAGWVGFKLKATIEGYKMCMSF